MCGKCQGEWCEFGQDFKVLMAKCIVPSDCISRTSKISPREGYLLASELQSYRVTDTQGYSVYGGGEFFVPDFNKLPYSLPLQGDK